MKLNARMIATAAFAAFLIPAFNLFAGEAAKPLAGGAKEDKAASSSVAVAADPAAPLPAAPMPSGSMGPARPYSGVRYGHTPRIEWFMGYTYLRAVPELAAGNGWFISMAEAHRLPSTSTAFWGSSAILAASMTRDSC